MAAHISSYLFDGRHMKCRRLGHFIFTMLDDGYARQN